MYMRLMSLTIFPLFFFSVVLDALLMVVRVCVDGGTGMCRCLEG